MVLKVFLVTYMLIDMIPPQRWHASITTKTQKLACSGDFFWTVEKWPQTKSKVGTKNSSTFFSLDFFGNPKKTQKVAKMQLCNFATLQLFHVVVFFNCFLIKKGKKVQKLQSCKVAFCNFLVFFCLKKIHQKKSTKKKYGIPIWKVSIPGTFPLFFLWEKISQASIPRTFSLSFFVGKKSHKLPFQEPSP